MPGVAGRIELYRVSEQHRPAAIHVEPTALVNESCSLAGYVQPFRDVAGDGIVMAPFQLGVLPPTVELPIDRDEPAVLYHESGSDIPQPGVVEVDSDLVDRLSEAFVSGLQILWVAQHPHWLILADGIGHQCPSAACVFFAEP